MDSSWHIHYKIQIPSNPGFFLIFHCPIVALPWKVSKCVHDFVQKPSYLENIRDADYCLVCIHWTETDLCAGALVGPAVAGGTIVVVELHNLTKPNMWQ